MKATIGIAIIASLALACVSQPPPRPSPPPLIPDAARIRAAFGLVEGQLPDARKMAQIGNDIWSLCKAPHAVRTSLDLAFDGSHRGHIDEAQLKRARSFFFGSQLLQLNQVDPSLANRLSAPPRTALSPEDIRIWNEYLFVHPGIHLAPHAFINDFERKLAGNAAFFDQSSIRGAVGLVSNAAAEAFLKTRPMTAAAIPAPVVRGAVKSQLQAYANTSGSGSVSEQEAQVAEKALVAPHQVKTAFDHAIDFASDGFVDAADIAEARRAAFVPAPAASPPANGPFPVITRADALLDIDGDGVVTEAELQADAQALLQGGRAPVVPAKLLAAFNLRGDGNLDPKEAERAVEFFRPHPVNPKSPLDLSLDVEHRGFLSPEDIGLGAGQSPKGRTLSLDERIQSLRMAARKAGPAQAASSVASAVVPRKKVDPTGKKLAVISLSSATKNLDQETLDGTTTFLENAFVNVGSVDIVDRQDIDKVMAELELQASDAFSSNEGAALKVGKLSGADIIVTGTISLVGKKYYLNVRLISVETGEVLGSSISSADSPDQFLDMCQQAAARMF